MAAKKRGAVNSSATHVFEVLRFVANAPEPLGVTEIGRRLSLPVSTVFRALSTLEDASYIQRFQNAPRFEIGTMPCLLTRALLSRFSLHGESRATLTELAQASEDTVSLWMRLGWFAVRIGGAFGRRDTYHNARLGDTVLLHEHIAGRTVLAAVSEEERRRYAAFVTRHHAARLGTDERRWKSNAPDDTPHQEKSEIPGLRASSIAVRDETGAAIGALASEGPATDDDGGLGDRLREARHALEMMIAADPEKHRSPFAHIPADEIRLDLRDRTPPIA